MDFYSHVTDKDGNDIFGTKIYTNGCEIASVPNPGKHGGEIAIRVTYPNADVEYFDNFVDAVIAAARAGDNDETDGREF